MYQNVESYKHEIYCHQKIIQNWEEWADGTMTREDLDKYNKKLREEIKNLI